MAGMVFSAMRAKGLNVLMIGGALAAIAGAPALPQALQPYNIETFGVFRNLMMTGDFSAKVRLDDAMAKHPTTGVGALADARGEIMIVGVHQAPWQTVLAGEFLLACRQIERGDRVMKVARFTEVLPAQPEVQGLGD